MKSVVKANTNQHVNLGCLIIPGCTFFAHYLRAL